MPLSEKTKSFIQNIFFWTMGIVGFIGVFWGWGVFSFLWHSTPGHPLAFEQDGKAQQALRTSGQPATATIVSITETNHLIINSHPEVKMVLEVHYKDTPAYQIDIVFVPTLVALAQLVPGREIDVVVDPNNLQHVVYADASLEY